MVPKHQRGVVSGYATALTQIGGVLGSTVGFFYTKSLVHVISLGVGGLTLLTLLITLLSVPSNPPHKLEKELNLQSFRKEEGFFASFLASFRDVDFRWMLVAMFLVNSGDSIVR